MFVDTSPKQHTEVSSLIDLLQYRAYHQPDELAYQFLIDGKQAGPAYTNSMLDLQARAIAARLAGLRGERALLLYPQGIEVMAAFFGCLYAGVIAIPVPPPDAGRLKRTLPRLQEIVKDAEATLVLSTERIINLIQTSGLELSEFRSMRWLNTEQIDLASAKDWIDLGIGKDELIYLQYTSGSTSVPKGVMLSHDNLIHHLADLQRAFGYGPGDPAVNWMPYFHDYGLVQGLLEPFYNGSPCYIMSPQAFMKAPLRWLQAISQYRATHSQAPNFAYDLCVRRIKPSQKENLDLSCWKSAGNGAEPINPQVLRKFYDVFQDCGFQWEAFAPSYGLAEATLVVSTTPPGRGPRILTLDAAALEQGRVSKRSVEERVASREAVSCGKPVCETQVVIADPDTLTGGMPNQVGEVWVADPAVAQGYWQNKSATTETFRAYLKDTGAGPFLRTGDLGFIQDGELYISGRLKDLLIIRGANHYPHDLEWTVTQCHPALRPECGAAFSIDVDGSEQLVIVQEIARSHLRHLDVDEVIRAIRQAITEHHELQVYAVALLKTASIPKTSSGKIQRRACRAGYLAGSFDVVGEWTLSPQTAQLEMATFKSDIETFDQPLSHPENYSKEQEKPEEVSSGSSVTKPSIQDWLIDHLAAAVQIDPDDIDIEEPFSQYGLDSHGVMSMAGELSDWLDYELEPTIFWEYPSIESLTQYLETDILPG